MVQTLGSTTKTHGLTNSTARSKVKNIIKNLPIKVTGRWDGDEFVFDGKGINSGRVKLSDKKIVVEVDLSWIGKPFKAKAKQKIRETLDEEFG